VKLTESGLGTHCDQIWLVTAPSEQQITRLMERNRLTQEAAAQRVAAQPDRSKLAEQATVVIHNDASIANLDVQVEAAWSTYVRPYLDGAVKTANTSDVRD
jgi:dephospho-CoA kinase